ncbi:PIN domain-containing protein [Microcoleus sp. BROC3]|uniref:PIN domain-containing protein n=1 Tax=Microcoleus sp. BROC3 TaxID=3055323 RepID=UPI002FD51B32
MATKKTIKRFPFLVALDTEVFYKSHLSYDSTQWKALITFVREEKIKLFVTSITIHEVRKHITEQAQLISQVINHFVHGLLHKKFQPSKDSPKITIPTKSTLLNQFKKQVEDLVPDFEQINQEIQNKFEVLFEQAKLEIIDIDGVSVDDVFKSYFSCTPPFSEKKKNEFPDAFALLALQKAAQDKNQIICVVSGDSDWENYCISTKNTHLCYFKSLEDLLESINEGIDSDEFSEIYELFQDKQDDIKEEIKKKFLEFNFSVGINDSSLEWGSVKTRINVKTVYIGGSSLIHIVKSSLINVDGFDINQVLVTFKIAVIIGCDVKINYTRLVYEDDDDEEYNIPSFVKEEREIIVQPSYDGIYSDVELTLMFTRDENNTLCDPVIKYVNINPDNDLNEIFISSIIECEDE